MDEILSGKEGDPLIAAFLAGLAVKGESVEELVGFAQAIRARAVDLGIKVAEDISGTEREALVDTCGTGGDVSGTFNISTAVSFVVAGAGVRVAKHGNRSATSKCGSADVMEALGVRLDLPAERLAAALDEVGIVFLFAQAMHSAMKYAAPARRALRPLRTAFNLLGPLTNPAGASVQVVGVYEASVAEKIALALRELGSKRAFVVHGLDGLDEISTTGETLVAEVASGEVGTYLLSPRDFGVPRATMRDLAGSDSAAENAALVRDVLSGAPGPRRDIVLVNASAALVAAGRASSWLDGVAMAAESIDSSAARGKLESLAAFSER
jgi:anthranilate phosphoribosyltransferase